MSELQITKCDHGVELTKDQCRICSEAEHTYQLEQEIERLTGRLSCLDSIEKGTAKALLVAMKEIESLTAEGTDRWDAWWEMRDDFECSKGPFTSEQALEIMDSYETIGMAEYRKVRDSGRQETLVTAQHENLVTARDDSRQNRPQGQINPDKSPSRAEKELLDLLARWVTAWATGNADGVCIDTKDVLHGPRFTTDDKQCPHTPEVLKRGGTCPECGFYIESYTPDDSRQKQP